MSDNILLQTKRPKLIVAAFDAARLGNYFQRSGQSISKTRIGR